MFGLQFLDLVIGLVFVYLIYSLAASTIWEIIANLRNLRSRNLKKWVMETLDRGCFGEKILEHLVIKGICRKGRRPSYIPARLFADVFLHVISKEKSDEHIRAH